MDEDEDEVFGPISQCWPSSNREIKQEDHSTQTPGSPAVRLNGMLPCGVAEEPRRLFYGKPDTEKQLYQLGELKKKKKCSSQFVSLLTLPALIICLIRSVTIQVV